jgi:heme-degrading monooxygenase HmoA
MIIRDVLGIFYPPFSSPLLGSFNPIIPGNQKCQGLLTCPYIPFENPFRVVVASNWRNIEDWNNWGNSGLRKSIEQKFDELLDGETEYEIFEMGFYPHHLHRQ